MSQPARSASIDAPDREDGRTAPQGDSRPWGSIDDLEAASRWVRTWIHADAGLCARIHRSPVGGRVLAAVGIVADQEWQQVAGPYPEQAGVTREERVLLLRAARSRLAFELRALPSGTRREVWTQAKSERDRSTVARLFGALSRSEAGRGVSRLEIWRRVAEMLDARSRENARAFGGAWRIAEEQYRDLHARVHGRDRAYGREESRERGGRER